MLEKSQDLPLLKETTLSLQHPQIIKQNSQQDSSIEYFFSVLKRRWLIVTGVCFVITGAIAWWAFQQSPIDQGKFMLLLEKQTVQTNNKLPNNNNNNLKDNSTTSPDDYST